MIYADNAATTKLDLDAFNAMRPFLLEDYSNASQPYSFAKASKKALKNARESIAKCINAEPNEIFFTSGGTESDNWALKGIMNLHKPNSVIITSEFEHHAVLNSCKYLESCGYKAKYICPTKEGFITPKSLKSAISENAVLSSVMMANNEIGTIQPIKELCAVAHENGLIFHTDAVQAVGNIPIDVHAQNIDLLSLSGHKFHGPKGVGAAYIRGDEYGLPPITAFMHGGEQEFGIRAGTLAVHNIVGFGKAAELALARQEADTRRLREIDQAARALFAKEPQFELMGDPQEHIPGLLSIVVRREDFDNERFIKKVSDQYAISAGSACTAGEPSHVLQAIGRSDETSRVLRISLSDMSSLHDVKTLIELLKNTSSSR